jgi:hypothetical protein
MHTITFKTDGGTVIPPITQGYGTNVTAPEYYPTREGYEFARWDQEIPATMPDHDMTITALWNKIVTVTADAQTKTYGEQDPELTYTAEGLADGAALSGALSREPGSDAGEYNIMQGDLAAPDGYVIRFTGAKLTINKKALTVTANNKTITYGDAPANGGVSYDGFAAGEDESNLTGTLSYDYGCSQFGDVGTYIITPGGIISSNYAISFVDGILTVEKKEVSLIWGNTELTYTGEAQVPTAELEGVVNGDDVSVSVAGAMTDVGTGEAKASLTGAKARNYKLPETNTTSFSITAAEMAVSAVGYTGTYDGAVHGITVTAPDGATVTYSNAESGTYGTDNPTYADAGVYTVYYKVEKANYSTVTGSATVAIAKKNIAGADITLGSSLTYTGSEQTQTVTRVVVDELEVTGYTVSGNTGTDAGNYTLTVTAPTAGNFTGTATKSWSIAQALNSVTVSITGWTYGDTANAPTSTAAFGTATYSYSNAEDGEYTATVPTNAGTWYIKASVEGTTNYAAAFDVKSFSITKKALTITADSAEKVYDGTALTKGTYTNTALASGDAINSVTVTGTQTDVGSSDNVPSAAVIKKSGTDVTANYSITYEKGKLTVAKATSNSVTVDITGWTYGDAANAPTSTATFGTATYTYSNAENGEYTATVPSTAGTWYVKATVADTDNYAGGEAVKSFKIAKKQLTIKADDKTKVYDNNAAADPALTATVDGPVGSDTLNYTPDRAEGENAGE